MKRSKQLRLPTGNAADYLARLICVASLIWFGLIVSQSLGDIRKRIRNGMPLEAEGAIISAPSIPVGAGYWGFAGTNLIYEKTDCAPGNLKQCLDRATGDAHLSCTNFDASQLIALAKFKGATPSELAGGTLWSYRSNEFCLRLHVSNEVQPRLLAAAIGMKTGERWNVTLVNSQAENHSQLLPLPSDAAVSCSRFHSDGDLQTQLVTTSAPSEGLLRLWRENGWIIAHTQWGASDSFSFFCVKRDQTVYAWSGATQGQRAILLTRTSGTSATRNNF